MMYQLALETGFRVGEILSLEHPGFDLISDSPCITVRAAYSKRRRNDIQDIRPEFAVMLHDYLQDKTGDEPIFRIKSRHKLAETVRQDMEAATLDPEGMDFHSFRHTFITMLTSGGVTPKNAQVLARHSTITLTMDRYSHTVRDDTKRSLDALPSFDLPEPQQQEQKATGTDDSSVSYMCQNNDSHRGTKSTVDVVCDKVTTHDKTLHNNGKTAFARFKTRKAAVGFEPTVMDLQSTPLVHLGTPPENQFDVSCFVYISKHRQTSLSMPHSTCTAKPVFNKALDT